MSVALEVDFGRLPAGVRSMVIDYRQESLDGSGATQPWQRAGEFFTSPAIIRVSDEIVGPIEIRFRARGSKGILLPGSFRKTFGPIGSTKLADRPSVGSLSSPEPKIQHDPLKGTLEISQDAPFSTAFGTEDEDEYVHEVRISTDPAEEPEDAKVVGDVEASSTIRTFAPPGAGTCYIHTRSIRKEDQQLGPWQKKKVLLPTEEPQEMVAVDDDDASFADITPTDFGFGDSMEVVAGDLQMKPVGSIWGMTGPGFDSIWGMTGEAYAPIWGVHDFYQFGEFETDWLDQPNSVVADLIPQPYPEGVGLDLTGQADPMWGNNIGVIPYNPRLANFDGYLWHSRNFQIFDTSARQGNNFGLEVDEKIAVDETGTGDAVFEQVVPGHRYRAKRHKYKVRIQNRFSRQQILFTRYRRRRLLRNRKWEAIVPVDDPFTGTMVLDFTSIFGTVPEFEVTQPTLTLEVFDSTGAFHVGTGVVFRTHVTAVNISSATISISQEVFGTAFNAGGNFTFNYPRAFAVQPVGVCSPYPDPAEFAGFIAIGTAAAGGYFTTDTGIPGTGSAAADVRVVGVPDPTDLFVKVILAGY